MNTSEAQREKDQSVKTPPPTAVYVEPTEAFPYDGDIMDQSLPTTSLLQGNTDRLAWVSYVT